LTHNLAIGVRSRKTLFKSVFFFFGGYLAFRGVRWTLLSVKPRSYLYFESRGRCHYRTQQTIEASYFLLDLRFYFERLFQFEFPGFLLATTYDTPNFESNCSVRPAGLWSPATTVSNQPASFDIDMPPVQHHWSCYCQRLI
jgi:hypothetical protein